MLSRRTFVRRDTFLPFSRPTIRQIEIDEVVDTLKSGWLTTGPKAERFEKAFAEYTGAPALAVSSATAGLHIGLLALGVEPGDEVITTPITWAATVNMIEALGARPVFVDSRFGFFSISGIVAVPLRGMTRFGSWNVHGGVEFQGLGDTTTAINGKNSRTIGSIGFGVVY